jgi:hypothetical protein
LIFKWPRVSFCGCKKLFGSANLLGRLDMSVQVQEVNKQFVPASNLHE